MSLKEIIKERRPALSDSSITTYDSILRSLYKKVFGEDIKNVDEDVKRFEEHKKIMEHLRDVTSNKRKTVLSALVILTENKKYRKKMNEDVKEYNEEIKKQVKNETQKENWIEVEEIKDKYEEVKTKATKLMRKKDKTTNDLQEIQNYIILSVLSGIYIPPRRSKDYVDFKIKNIDEEKDNYMKGNKFIFNSYKTAKTYGQQTVVIPLKLKNIIKKWIKMNPTEYLLFDSNGNKMSNVKLTQRLNKIFDGKNISVNNLRHTKLTDKYKTAMELMKDVDEIVRGMGTSKSMLSTYVKLD